MTAENKAPDSGVASLCSRKRKQTLEGPLPLVADPLANAQAQGTRVKRKRGGRPREAIRTRVREKRISFAVSEYEDATIRLKYKRARQRAAEFCRAALIRCDIGEAKYTSFLRDIDSLTHSEFCRMVVLSTTMVEAISDDERYVIQNLHKMGQRLNQLFVQGKLNSHVNALAEYNAFMADFAEIKAYYQKKVRRL